MSKLFNKWDLDEVKVEDLGLVKYICLDETLVHSSFIPFKTNDAIINRPLYS